MSFDIGLSKLKESLNNKNFYLFFIAFFCFSFLLLAFSAIFGEFFTEKVIYVQTKSAYHVYSEKGGRKRNANPIFRDCEYRLPKNTDFWCVSIVDGTESSQIEVVDSQTDVVLANQSDCQKDQYGFQTLKIKCPSISERLRGDCEELSKHCVLISSVALWGIILAVVCAFLLANKKAKITLAASIVLSGLSIFILNLCLSFAGNPLIISLLTFFVFPFLSVAYLFMLRSPWAAILLFAIVFAFTLSRRNEWLDISAGPVRDYRQDFAVSLAYIEEGVLAKPGISFDESTLELRKFIHLYTGGLQQGRWGLPDSYIKRFLTEHPPVLKTKRTMMGLRSYLYWITAQLWAVLGVNWSVFAGFFIFLSFLSVFVLIFSLYLLGGKWSMCLGGLLVIFVGVDYWMMYGNTRNYVVYPASCFIIFSSVIIPKVLLRFHCFSCKKTLFYLLFFFFGAEIAFWCFWRSDVKSLILPAAVLPFCIAWDHDKKSVKIRRIVCSVVAAGVGFVAMQWITLHTTAKYLRDNTGQFHTAACGEEVRAAVTGIEQNNWLYFSDLAPLAYVDNMTDKHYHYGTPEYDTECMKMYLKSIAFSGKDYVQSIPQWGIKLLECFFVKSSEFFKSFFAKLCVLALLGGLICSTRFGAQMGFLLSFLWLLAVLFIVLPMQKHFCTIVPWLAVVVGLGGRTIITFPLECTWNIALKSLCALLGAIVIAAIGYVASRIISAQTHRVVEAQIGQVEKRAQQLTLPVSREHNAVQLKFSERPICRRVGIKLHLNNVNPESRLCIAFESDSEVLKARNFIEGGGRIQCFYPKGEDFFVVVPVICRAKDPDMYLTFFADKVQIDEKIKVYNADDFTFLPGFSVGMDKAGKIVHGRKIGEVNPLKYKSGFAFALHCKYKDGALDLPYHKQINLHDDAVTVE